MLPDRSSPMASQAASSSSCVGLAVFRVNSNKIHPQGEAPGWPQGHSRNARNPTTDILSYLFILPQLQASDKSQSVGASASFWKKAVVLEGSWRSWIHSVDFGRTDDNHTAAAQEYGGQDNEMKCRQAKQGLKLSNWLGAGFPHQLRSLRARPLLTASQCWTINHKTYSIELSTVV